MTKIDIISGFLGAGKTTLIKKLLEEALRNEKVVLIENEFGQVSIDGGFLKDAGVEIKEMVSGCICCTLVGDFYYGVRDVIDQFHPDRIIIEPSGVGKLSDVMSSVILMKDKGLDVQMNALVTVVNTPKVEKQIKAFGEFLRNQIEHATTIVLSRTQNMEDAEIESAVKAIRALNSEAAVITTPWDKLTGAQMLAAIEHENSLMEQIIAEVRSHEQEFVDEHGEDLDEEHEHHHHDHEHDHEDEHGHHHEHEEHGHHHEHKEHGHEGHEHEHHHHHHHDHDHHHADEVFTSWGKETPHKYTKEAIEAALKAFSETTDYGTVLRAKGMVEAEDGSWIYFDMVPGEYELREGSPDYTGRLCVIGTDLDEAKLEDIFA